MKPDNQLRDYYNSYVNNVNEKYEECEEKLNTIKNTKDELYDKLIDKIDILSKHCGVNLNNYELEWNKKEFNPSKTLYQKTLKMIKYPNKNIDREIVLNLLRYCQTLEKEDTLNQNIKLLSDKKNLLYKKYKDLVNLFYNRVQTVALKGNGYKFNYGLGTFIINYWVLDKPRITIDFNETNKKKREILAKGGKLFNAKDAEEYKRRGIPYNREDYRVFKKVTYVYDITFVDSTIFRRREMEYERSTYTNSKYYAGMTHQQIADSLESIEDVYNIKGDVNLKLKVLLCKSPDKYLNFIRNASKQKYNH